MANVVIFECEGNRLFAEMLRSQLQCFIPEYTDVFFYTEGHRFSSQDLIIFPFETHVAQISRINQSLEADIPMLIIGSLEMGRPVITEMIRAQRRFGVVSCSVTFEELKRHIDRLLKEDEKWLLSQELQSQLLEDWLEAKMPPEQEWRMTEVESRIIELGKKGFSIRQMAGELSLSPNTIASYRSKLLKKSGAKSLVQLISKYV